MTNFVKTRDTYVAGQLTLPSKYYVSPEVFELEKENIFGGWVCAGHVSRIPGAGEYFLFNIFEESIIVVREKDGSINAFYNVCRHRGTKVCEADGKVSASFQCPYHAWTYSVKDGALIGAPFMKGVDGFEWEKYPLKKVPVHVWEGLIFVSLSENPKPFEKIYAPLIGKFSKWNLGKLKSHKRISYSVKSNWKYVFQNFNECYHCPSIHPALNQLLQYTGSMNDLTEGNVLGGYFDINGESMTLSGHMSALPLGDLGEDIGRAYYYTFLPNLLINLHPDYLMFHLVIPVSANESVVISEWLFNLDSFDKENFHPEDAEELWDETNKQDWHVCELAQLGVISKAYEPGWYTPQESLLAAFDRYYLTVMKVPLWKKIWRFFARLFSTE